MIQKKHQTNRGISQSTQTESTELKEKTRISKNIWEYDDSRSEKSIELKLIPVSWLRMNLK